MNSKFKTLLLILLILIFSVKSKLGFSQAPLENYLKEGLQNNLVLQQKNISLEKAMYSLKIANSYFLPSVNFNGAYTHGQGGRTIAIPVGDLLNPVYATLNKLTESNNFPQIANVEQTFFPRNFYDAHIRTSVPVLNTDLYLNKSIQEDQVLLQGLDVKVYERELIKEIKTAYYNYLSALEAVKIFESALGLVQQNVAVNQSLLKNGKGLPASVLRAQSEYENINAQLFEAGSKVKNAQSYFNFLLNRSTDSPIDAPANIDPELEFVAHMVQDPNVSQREELSMLKTGRHINETSLRMNRMFAVPKVNAFMDLGAQAENMKFYSGANYYLLGISLDIPIFNGSRNNYKIRQSLLEVKSTDLSIDYTSRQLEMAADIAKNDLLTAYQNYNSAQRQLQAAQSYFTLIDRGYKEGTNSMIEFIDGRNQLTTSQLQLTLNTYKVLIALANYERETASYQLN